MVRTAKAMRRNCDLPIENFGLFKVDDSKPPPFYTEEEYGRLIEAALKIDLRLATVVLLGGDPGLRSGEIRALRPFDLKWAENHLHVEKQVWRNGQAADRHPGARGAQAPHNDDALHARRQGREGQCHLGA